MLFVIVQNALITDIYLYILDIENDTEIWYIVYIINYRRFTIMNIKGRVLAMVSACVVIFSQSSIATFALDNQEVLTLPTSVSDLTSAENMGQVVKIRNLHGADEGTIAFCAEMESGYVIYDLSGNTIEYSPTSSSPYSDLQGDLYYAGPLEYLTKTSTDYKNLRTGEILTDEQFNEVTESFTNESIKLSSTNFMSSSASRANSGFRTAVSKVSGTPRKLNYNTSNQCGALAAVINLCYIDDYKDNNCLSDSYSNNPRSLFNTLNNYIPRETSRNGIINGLSNAKKDKICSFTSSPDAYYGGDSWGFCFYRILTSNSPTILLIIKHPNYGGNNDKNHWVLTYGIVQCFDNNNKLVDKYFIVNDGYGKNDIRIHYTYQDDCVYI